MFNKSLKLFKMFAGCVALLYALVLVGDDVSVVPAAQSKKNVLVLHSYHEGLSWTDGENAGIKEGFAGRDDIELNIEYLNSKRMLLEQIDGQFADFLEKKYSRLEITAIIVSDDNAFNFMARHWRDLFPGAPVIFCGVNKLVEGAQRFFDGRLTGVLQTHDPSGTVELILRLQPDLHSLVVVSDKTATSVMNRDKVRESLEKGGYEFKTIWLEALDTLKLKERVSELSVEDAILLCNFNRDASGVYYSHEESARMISSVSSAPVYAMVEQYLGTGVVGGYMKNSRDQGVIAAKLCQQVIDSGEIPAIRMNESNRAIFDYRAMKRFGLDSRRLPASARIINRPISFYHQNKALIWNLIIGFVVLLAAFFSTAYWLISSKLAERDLRQSEESLRTTLNSIGDAVITTDIRGNVMRMNPVARELTGWTEKAAQGRALTEVFKIVNALTNEPVENPVKLVLTNGEIVGLANHTALISQSGDYYQIADSAAPIKDDTGKITGVVLVFRDVTEDYKLRSALQHSERQYRLFAENSVDLIWTCAGAEQKFSMTYVNPAVEKMLGYTVEEYLALPVEKRLTPESIAKLTNACEQCADKTPCSFDIQNIHKDGHLVDCEIWIRPLMVDSGGLAGLQGRTIDITERKRAEQRLAEINACMVNLGADYNANINALTALCGRLLGATCALYNRLQGKALVSVGCWHYPQELEIAHNLEGRICYELIKSGKVEPYLVRNLTDTIYARLDPSIKEHGLQTYLGYPATCAGQIVGTLCVVYKEDIEPSADDLRVLGIIAAAVAAEEERRHAADELHRMQRLEELGMVAGGIAHDFNNLLTGIFGNFEMARLHLPAESKAARYLDDAIGTIETARNLTGQLLTFAKGGAPSLDSVNIEELVNKTVLFNLHGSNVRAEFDLQTDLWSVEADKGQIGQVIANLVVNARQAMPVGGVVGISAYNIPRRADNDRAMVCITISDEGGGIPAENLDRIFDPYFTTRQNGHGLGLAVVHSIVTRHNGRVEVVSYPGHGSTFSVYLPALPEVVKTEADAVAAVESEGKPQQRDQIRVLLMDDEEILCQLGKVMLGHIGCECETVADGDAAIAAYIQALKAGRPYDLVILDLTIRGGRGGKETIARLLELDQNARVIVASGYASDPVMANYADHGFAGKLAKPYMLADMKKVVEQVLG